MSDLNETNIIWADSTSGRLLDLIDGQIERIGLKLDGLTILTDARTEEDFVTILLAARAGAHKIIAAAPLRATVRSAQVEAIARRVSSDLDLGSQIEFIRDLKPGASKAIDIVAVERQSSLIKPAVLETLPASCVLAMLFDTRGAVSGGLDMTQRGAFELKVAGVNIADPQAGVSEFLAPLCLLQMELAGIEPSGKRVLLLCDNEMATTLKDALRAGGADVTLSDTLDSVDSGPFDVLVLAMTPSREYRLDMAAVSRLPELLPNGIVVQFWGDIDRSAARYFSVEISPAVHPGRGQMGIRLAALGSEPVVALRGAALKAAADMLEAPGSDRNGPPRLAVASG